jgi:RNA polymerase sigma-70 factor, ECF subfamily
MNMVVDAEIQSLEQLAAKAQAGCPDSFSQLVEHLNTRLYHFLCHMGVNHHDAEDLTQEAFVRAYRNLHRYNSQFSFVSWLFTIAKRLALNYFRDTKATCELTDEQTVEPTQPAQLLEEKDEHSSLWELAKSLKPAQFEALWLRYGEGLSIVETAQVMRTNQIRVRVLLHRGRSLLAKKLTYHQTGPSPHPMKRLL